jgi:hypothetical protein
MLTRCCVVELLLAAYFSFLYRLLKYLVFKSAHRIVLTSQRYDAAERDKVRRSSDEHAIKKAGSRFHVYQYQLNGVAHCASKRVAPVVSPQQQHSHPPSAGRSVSAGSIVDAASSTITIVVHVGAACQ